MVKLDENETEILFVKKDYNFGFDIFAENQPYLKNDYNIEIENIIEKEESDEINDLMKF